MKIMTAVLGTLGANCYIAGDDDQLLIIDPGDCPPGLITALEEDGRKPVAILLTHGHFDHVLGVDALVEHFNLPVYALDKEEEAFADVRHNLSGELMGREEMMSSPVTYFTEGDILELAGLKIRTIWVPGHSAGGCCYYIPEEKVLFSGDCLFYGSIGRTDLPGGDYGALISGLKEKVLTLPDETDVFPGHGPATTIAFERTHNPYLAG